MEFRTSFSIEQIDNNFKDVSVFNEIMEGLKEICENEDSLNPNSKDGGDNE